MKRMFFVLIMLFISQLGFSQAQNGARQLMIINNTNCDQTFEVFGGNFCKCVGYQEGSVSYNSSFITIFAGQTVVHTDTTTLGGLFSVNPPGFVYGARITEGYPTICGIHGGTVGQPNCVGAGLTYSFIANNSDCSTCGSTTATWYPADCEGMARLVFTP